MRPRAARLGSRLGLATVLAAGLLGLRPSPAAATHPGTWPGEQRRLIIYARAASGIGHDLLAGQLATGLTIEQANDARSWAALAYVRGLTYAWSGGPSAIADEAQGATLRACELDRGGEPTVSLARGVAALVTATRSSDPGERRHALLAAESELLRVSGNARAPDNVRFAAEVARFVVACEDDDSPRIASTLAGALAAGREAQLPDWWIRHFRELVLDRLDSSGESELALDLASELSQDPAWGRKSEVDLALVRARARLSLDRPQEALRDLARVPLATSRGLEVEAWLALGRPESALACARRVRNTLGAGHEGDELVGRALLALRQFGLARGAFERALSSRGAARCARCCGGLALALAAGASASDPASLAQGDLARARRLSSKADEIDGGTPEALLARAALARMSGELIAANRLEAEARVAALPREAATGRALRERARRALAGERWGEAATRAAEILSRGPGDLDALGVLAHALVRAGHPSSRLVLERFADLSPQDAWAHLERGRSRLAAHRPIEARADLERALALLGPTPRSPLRVEAQRALAQCPRDP